MLIRKKQCQVATLLFVSCLQMLLIDQVTGSPPLDFFRHSAAKNNHSILELPSIESIYKTSSYDSQLASELLEIVQNTSFTHDNDRVQMKHARLAWHLMEQQALKYFGKRVHELKPVAGALMREAQVSTDCRLSIESWLDHLAKLDLWASQMWNSWGDFPPAGLFKGSFNDLGSYRGCMEVKPNELIGEPQYCMLDFQPLVPTRPRFHPIIKKVMSIDPKTGQLTRGDFDSEPSLSSRHTAHNFRSSHYEYLSNKPKRIKDKKQQPTGRLNPDKLTIDSETMIELVQRAQYFYYVKFRMAACVPSKCSRDDVQNLAQAAGKRAILQATHVTCLKNEPVKLNNYQIFAIIVLGSLAVLALLATLLDLCGLKVFEWLVLFSMWTNGKKLFESYTENKEHANLEVMHGLRFLSMVWVIYGHTTLYIDFQYYTHAFDIVDQGLPNVPLLATLNGNYSVETFFVISGVLTTYVTLEYLRGDARKFNKLGFVLIRYFRLTPQLALIILIYFLLPLTGDGPFFKQITEYEAGQCHKGWLTNLLYLQTYTDSWQICIDPSWWLSIEMSFHVISVLVISVMIRHPRRGLALNFLIAAVLTSWGAIVHYTNGFAVQYMASITQRYEILTEQTNMFFHRPWPHAPSYFIGTALGYLLTVKDVKPLSKLQLAFGWTLSILATLYCIFGTYYWNIGEPYTQLTSTLYYNFVQILWPCTIAWIIYVCSIGQGGIVYSFMAAPIFAQLNRIGYMTYLSHVLIILHNSASNNVVFEPTIRWFFNAAISNTVLGLMLGFILTLVYEMPILNLQKHFMKPGSSKKRKSEDKLKST